MEKPLFPQIIIQVKIRQNWKPGYIWDVFDVIVAQMEKDDPKTGEPITTVLDRKKFRVEVMKARDDEMVAVFKKWVTVIIRHGGAGTPAEEKETDVKDAPMVDMTKKRQGKYVPREKSQAGLYAKRRKLTRKEKDYNNARDRAKRAKLAQWKKEEVERAEKTGGEGSGV